MRQKKYPILFFILLFFCLISSISFADDSKAKDGKAKDTESVSKVSDTKLTKNSGSTKAVSLNSIDWWGSQYVFVLRPGLLESLLPVAPKRPPPKMPPLPTDPRELCNYYLRQADTTFEARVTGCPQLANQILWQQPGGTRVRFSEWTRAQKDRINELYQRIQTNAADLSVRCTNPQDGINVESGNLYISEAEAFDMYAASIAQSVYLESNRLVPWSLLDNPSAENEAILDSSQYFSIIVPTGEGGLSAVRTRYSPGTSYQSPSWQLGSRALLSCDPRIPYRFLNGTYSSTHTNLIGSNQTNTINNISWWFHENVFHGNGTAVSVSERTASQTFLMNRLSLATLTSSSGISGRGVIAPAGCHSAANLFLELARGLNIPIRIFWFSDQGEPRGSFFGANSGAHMGIAYHWTRPDVSIVLHADDLYVQNKLLFPITGAHSVMLPDDTKSLFINTVWKSPSELAAWGIHYFSTLPLILPGQDIRQSLPTITVSTPHYGYFGAYNSLHRVSDNDYFVGSTARFYNTSYNTCGWSSYIESYCRDTTEGRLRFYGEIYGTVNRYFTELSQPLPISHSVEEHVARVTQCVEVNGGCAALTNMSNEQMMNFGQNYLRMP